MNKLLRRFAVLAAVSLAAAGCDDDDDGTGAEVNIVATARAAGQFNTLLNAVQAAGLTSTLETGGPFTVFAPTDAAFAAIPPATLNALIANQTQLRAVLTYHVVPGEVTAAQAAGLASAPTVNGKALAITNTGGVLRVGGARVVTTDIRASNGIIHVIDAVLIP